MKSKLEERSKGQLRCAAKSVVLAGAVVFFAGCVPPPNGPESHSTVDFFSKEFVKTRLVDPPVIPGLQLFVEVLASGVPVVREQNKIVSSRNDVSLPLLGNVDCTGMGLQQVIDKLTKDYSELYHNPSVTVTFMFSDGAGGLVSPWGTVNVYGCVMREGTVNIPSTNELTLTRAIQLVGGMTAFANRRRIRVTREMDGETQSKDFNFEDISLGKIPDPPLLKGDRVRVFEATF